MTIKILLTGNNRRIVGNISEHLVGDKGYKVTACEPDYEALLKTISRVIPNIIIICLGDEEKDTIRVFNTLTREKEAEKLPVIVVAHKEDLNNFKAYIKLDHLYFLQRPVSILSLYSLLGDIEKEMDFTLSEEEHREKERKKPKMQPESRIRRKKILVVDDDAEQLAIIKGHLEDFYDVTAVRSGFDALKFLEKHEVDLMLLDYVMPVMDGPKVLYNLRTTRAYAGLPVIFLTGINDREKVVKTLVELRPRGYIVKPARKSEIVAKIIDVLG